ncbi:MAG TPA: bifunctional phosphoribosylaminoimidazolecarboxamide formyltransferase/IMP cyclohydrolase [Burkholderiales bacterium]|nr:bifunctional phosphoribosylaminoimidazolecarboxamide formyltransferase/IMP cyclohydrolase [Burkholderiales bacterium]
MKQALISVSDKTGIVGFAKALSELGVALISTGGTAVLLREAGLCVTEVSEYTGVAEMLDGRVKTLHPRIHAGILARRSDSGHMRALEEYRIPPIDLVVVNLYPFAQTIAHPDCPLAEAIENIDIGGPTLLRAAAKNHESVAVVSDPADYAIVLKEMAEEGGLSPETRFRFAAKAFSHTAEYDGAISNYLTGLDAGSLGSRLNLHFERVQRLRYGENPHQSAAFYRDPQPAPGSLANYQQLQGKDLSYNNIADSDAAWECVKTFEAAACVIVKHANPCGVAIAENCLAAYSRAFATDPTSAFGGIIAFNCEVDAEAAQTVTAQFLEVLIAPEFSPAAREILAQKSNVRVLQVPVAVGANRLDFKRVGGGLLAQTPDDRNLTRAEFRVVTKRAPTDEQMEDLLFAWRVAKFVKSNAIVFCRQGRTLGIGAGQMSRVDSARIAAMKADHACLSLTGSVVASDAFFPFRDGVDVVAKVGARAVVQPGGSVRDQEVMAAADELGLAMVFTGVRHFRH